jgi:hypothetical protein
MKYMNIAEPERPLSTEKVGLEKIVSILIDNKSSGLILYPRIPPHTKPHVLERYAGGVKVRIILGYNGLLP